MAFKKLLPLGSLLHDTVLILCEMSVQVIKNNAVQVYFQNFEEDLYNYLLWLSTKNLSMFTICYIRIQLLVLVQE